MKIFVTGKNGFLATNIIHYCYKNNIDIIDDDIDLSFKNKFDNSYEDVDLFIHTAVSKKDDMILNQTINLNAISLWKNNFKNSKFIGFGSSGAYEGKIAFEKDYFKSRKVNSYIISKRNLLITLDLFSNWKYLILTSMFGENFKLNDNHLMHEMITKIYNLKMNKKIKKINLHKDSYRNFLYVNDVVNFIFDKKNDNEKMMNLAGNRVKLSYCAEIIANEFNYDLKFDDLFIKTKKVDGIDIKSNVVNFKFTPIEHSLKNTINYFKKINEKTY